MHFAAFALVGESVADPAKYYQNNVVASLACSRRCGSSTCGESSFPAPPRRMAFRSSSITEDERQEPSIPMGFANSSSSMPGDYAHAYGFGYAALRYFNAAGASPAGDLGEDHDPESHLIPIVLASHWATPEITVFGDDYPTPDGTCIRDYIHVDDLGRPMSWRSINSRPHRTEAQSRHGRGYSVREVIDACRRVTGRPSRRDRRPPLASARTRRRFEPGAASPRVATEVPRHRRHRGHCLALAFEPSGGYGD